MTVKELQQKFYDSVEKVQKRIKTLEKVSKKLEINSEDLIKKYHEVVNNDFEPYYLTNLKREEIITSFVTEKPERDENGKWLDENYHYNYKISELSDNLYKLYEIEKITHNWEVKLQKELNKDNIEKIKVIWDFLTDWENKTIEWYKENAKKYFELVIKEDEKLEEYKKSEQYKKDLEYFNKYHKYNPEYYLNQNWKQNYYRYIDNLTKEIVSFKRKYNEETYKTYIVDYILNEEVLKKVVAKEKKDKYFDLVERITKYIGEIKDAKYLSVSPQGELNGIIIGINGKVKIETISAGGYNIQRFHYRVLIHRVKDSL